MDRGRYRFAKYVFTRACSLLLVVIMAVYLTVLIAGMGGYVDQIIKNDILYNIGVEVNQNPAYRSLTPTERRELMDKMYEQAIRALGLDTPFEYRSYQYLIQAITLDLGRAMYLTSPTGSSSVRNIILERLPVTVLLFTTINMILFFMSLFFGLYASRRYGGKFDKIIIMLSPLSSIPGWFYGIFLIIVFASILHILPYGGLVDVPPPQDPLNYAISVLKHMVLPVFSWLISYSFIQIYVKRTFFLMFSQEDYVELARAKGLPSNVIERRYILRPTLPPIMTEFALTLISSWMGAIVTERVFNWPGIGTLFYQAATMFDSPVIIGEVVIYAYLLAVTVFILDMIYALVDPRIRMGAK
ncbi:MAG: ABC transporter permease [Nitrososphaerota archaeon]|nr:ABC transporter permease [Candidatus Bathyarchaeota archaeon]MDW8049053.1 ABC transporter permease [Nitrososphaerota archaeon]